MDTYKAKIYPGKFMDVVLFLLTPLAVVVILLSATALSMQEWAGALLLLMIPASIYVLSRLFRRRLHINIFDDGIDIHYLPQLLIQQGQTVHLSFKDIAGCDSGKLRAGRITNWFLIISLKNGKRYKVTSWIPPFQNVETYATDCERDITTAWRTYKNAHNS